jgi:hypothetical protein
MWSTVAGKMIETVWPGISELRTTAFRTGHYAGLPAPEFGPAIERTFKGQLEKCAEAGALRRAFPEEIGNALTAEEMEGQPTLDGAADAPEKPKPESVTPPRAGGERKPLPPLVSQLQSLTAASSAELPGPLAARQEGDPEIPHALAPASE